MTAKSEDKSPRFYTTESECWRLAKSCAQWAADTRDRSVRDAFMAMAKEWSRLGLQETSKA